MKHSRWYVAGLYIQSVFYAVAGLNHLVHPQMYISVMPEHYAHPGFWVMATGIAEIAGGVGLLLPFTRRVAALALVLMLLGYFDVHIFMLRHAARFPGIPHWALLLRLPLQFVLIGWAAVYALKRTARPQREICYPRC